MSAKRPPLFLCLHNNRYIYIPWSKKNFSPFPNYKRKTTVFIIIIIHSLTCLSSPPPPPPLLPSLFLNPCPLSPPSPPFSPKHHPSSSSSGKNFVFFPSLFSKQVVCARLEPPPLPHTRKQKPPLICLKNVVLWKEMVHTPTNWQNEERIKGSPIIIIIINVRWMWRDESILVLKKKNYTVCLSQRLDYTRICLNYIWAGKKIM